MRHLSVIPGNVTFLQGCAASLAGQESAVLIDSKALEASPLEVPGIAASTLGLLFVIVLPAALLAVGAWWSCCGAESEDLSMKAKQRTLGVLLFLILLAGGVFALLTLRNAREEQAASAAADGTIPLAAVSGNDLTQIVLHYQARRTPCSIPPTAGRWLKIQLTIWTPLPATRCSPRFPL